MSTINGPIQLKRGSGNILSDNQKGTTLAAAEPFYHVKTESLFIGNGVNKIGDLQYIRLTSDDNICIGKADAFDFAKNSVSIGKQARAISNRAISIGYSTSSGVTDSDQPDSICIGTNSHASTNSSIAIGLCCSTGKFTILGSYMSGANSIAMGVDCDSEGTDSICIGTNSHVYVVDSDSLSNSSIAIGHNAVIGGGANTMTSTCIAIGHNAKCTNGVRSISIGHNANSGGDGAVVVGSYASSSNATGPGSVSMLGYARGYGVAIGDISETDKSCVAIGPHARAFDPDVDRTEVRALAMHKETVAIGLEAVAGANIADTESGAPITYNYKNVAVQILHNERNISDGAFHVGGRAVRLDSSCDRRLKNILEEANTSLCLSDVNKIPLYRYEYKPFVKETEDKHLVGWMADDVETVFKHAVRKSPRVFEKCDEYGNPIINSETGETETFVINDVKTLDMDRVGLPTLWGAVQELSKLMTATQERVTELENAVKALKKENTLLKKQFKALEDSQKSEPDIEA